MRIVHLSCVAPPEIGGIGRAALKEVAMLRSRGFQAELIAPEMVTETTDRALESGFVTRIKPLLRLGNASILLGLRNALKKADIIHLHYPFFGVAEPLLLGSRDLPPIVITYHMDAIAGGVKGMMFGCHRLLHAADASQKSRRHSCFLL